MKAGEHLPDDQAEIVFNDVFVEYLEGLNVQDRESVLVEVLSLCRRPGGSHPLSNRNSGDRLAGWNTVEVLNREHRVVFASRIESGVGVIEVLCAGPRRADAAYDLANSLIATGRLTPDEVTEIWQALALLEVIAEEVGLDGWDYRPPPAPAGMIKTAVAAGLLDEHTAQLLSKDELEAALENGWGEQGPDPVAAVRAALNRARTGVDVGDLTRVLGDRATDRCGAILPRAGAACIRKLGHPGAHRSSP
ncbi:hypothetical protein [Terrabacter sp. C0L_2]|uniref:hypothetical protein n=1 Tax=Terrabacter sp. C0L_2 TaxID=3108389 RepID=UPI00183985D9|nr:hypothetical protein [Dermatophilaceae bacterium]WVM95520.1 hypothetical protein U5C87_16150 [Terrabacter sp. C0L_2]